MVKSADVLWHLAVWPNVALVVFILAGFVPHWLARGISHEFTSSQHGYAGRHTGEIPKIVDEEPAQTEESTDAQGS
jgi:hypothetical protein